MLQPPSPAQARSIVESTARLNIWDGSVRSGKTVASIVRWLEFVRTAPPGECLMVGKTERTLKRNVLDPIADMGLVNLRVVAGSGEAHIDGRRIYLAGAADERAEQKIRGLTLIGAYGDEVTLWPESFFTMLLSRMSLPGAAFFGSTNPDNPAHWLKRHYLDRTADLDLRRFRFTLYDNHTLDPAYVAALSREYTGLWRRRYILGEWCVAEGAIYDMLDPERHVVDTLPDAFRWHVAAVDYGTTNPTVWALLSLGEDGVFYAHDEWRWDSARRGRQQTDADYSAAFRAWLDELAERDMVPRAIFYDPSAASFGLQLQRDKLGWVVPADNEVLDGIRDVASLLATDRLKLHGPTTQAGFEELVGYAWDPKAQERGLDQPVKRADHFPDMLRYAVRGALQGTPRTGRSIWD